MENRSPCRWRHVLLLMAAFMVSAAARASTTLVLNAFMPAQDVMNVGVIKPWAQEVMRETHGRVKIIIPPTSLCAPDQIWNSVRSGVVDAAYLFNGTEQGKLGLMQMPHLPFLASNARGDSIAFWQTYEKFFRPADEYSDVHLLGLMVIPSGIIYSMKQPIRSIDDVKGVKMWALPGMPARVMQLSGAGVVSTPAAAMSELVAGGTVDGFAGIPDIYAESFKVARYARYATVVPGGLSTSGFSLIINKQKWESLTPEDRNVITRLSGAALAARMSAFDDAEKRAHAKAISEGVRYEEASPLLTRQLQGVSASLSQSWMKTAASLGVDGQAALAFYREQSKENRQ